MLLVLRALLDPLAEMAARRRVTVLLVKHLNKGVSARAVSGRSMTDCSIDDAGRGRSTVRRSAPQLQHSSAPSRFFAPQLGQMVAMERPPWGVRALVFGRRLRGVAFET